MDRMNVDAHGIEFIPGVDQTRVYKMAFTAWE